MVNVSVEYYNDNEKELFQIYPNCSEINTLVYCQQTISKDELLAYMMFTEQKEHDGFRNYEELRERVSSRLGDINDYFDYVYCLNLDRKLQNFLNIKEKCDLIGLKINRFSAVDGNNIHESILKQYNGINKYAVGCLLSHYNIIKDAKKNGYKKVLILEDDILFCNNFHEKFNDFLSKASD